MTDLTGRVALVTGAAQGLGLGIAERLAAAGATLALVDLPGEALASAATSLGDAALETVGESRVDTPPAEAFPADLADERVPEDVVERVVARFGRLDILVNNAGIRTVSTLLDHPLADWQRTLDVNLTAPFLMIQAAVPRMQRTGGGRIVNITSTAATLGFKNRAAYNVSKAGLAMLTKTVALELAGQGIRCNAVAPGVVETPLNSHYFDDPGFASVIIDNTPQAAWGRPADVAAAVAFLVGDDAGFVNGATLLVDGGWSTGKGY